MDTATFYVIHPGTGPSSTRCVHTSVSLESLHGLLGPACTELEFVYLPPLFVGLHAYVDGMGAYNNLRTNSTLAPYIGGCLHGTIVISRGDRRGADIGLSPMDVHLLDKLTGRI